MQSAGLYLHIPFCEKKCGYCDFYSVTATNQIDRYLTAIKKEISLIAENYSDYSFNTVYFGGGTPTILSVKQIRTIWYELQKRLAIQHPAEITIEANPGTINFQMMLELKMLGFNRLSLGVQSFHATDLKILGRIHGINDILGSFEAARKAGFNNINLDLLNAFPGLTLKRFEASLNAAVQLEPEHISCYNLIYERGTPFYKKLESGLFQQLSETEEAEYLIRTIDILDNAGYSAYEISNYSKSPEFYCQHN
jgi:oxygen-independent coproporphyrinogen-3 oxidase